MASDKPVDISKYVAVGVVVVAIGGSAAVTIWGLNSPLGKSLSKYLSTFAAAIGGLLDTGLNDIMTAIVVLGIGGSALYAVAKFIKSKNSTKESMKKVNDMDSKAGRSKTYSDDDFAKLDTNKPQGAQTVDMATTVAATESTSKLHTAEQRSQLASLQANADIAQREMESVKVYGTKDEIKESVERSNKARAELYEYQKKIIIK